MSISLNTYTAGETNYIAMMNADNMALKAAIEALQAQIAGAISVSANNMPKGLQYIYDRKGIIGKRSYKPVPGVLTAPNYNMTVAVGGFWDGSTLAFQDTASTVSMDGKSTATYHLDVDTSGSITVNLVASGRTIWQFDYDSGTHTVSDVALYSGIAILFDGIDYADALNSGQFSLNFESLADRLEEIEARLVEMGTFYAEDADSHSGLDFYYKAGKVRNDNVIWETSAGYVTLDDDTTNFVEVNPADGVVSSNTVGFTSTYIPLHKVVTASGAIDTVADRRTWSAAGGGGGGGHTQNTDTGTTANTFKLNMDEVGAPSEDCKLEVERGTAANVALKWNETENKWQFTNDGANYQDIFDQAAQLAVQEFTKYVGFENPQLVLEEFSRDPSADYEMLDLSSYITAPNGLQGVVLRVFFWDDTPAGDVYVAFRTSGGLPPTIPYSVWSDHYGSAILIIPISSEIEVEYYVAGSGAGSANLKVYLWGYMEKVTGVGTVHKETVYEGIEVAAESSTAVDISGCCNRGLAHYLKVTETGGSMTGNYDIELYADDAFTILLYMATGIDPAIDYEDWLPFWLRDVDSSSELHLKISNNDSVNAGVFDVEIHYEMFS